MSFTAEEGVLGALVGGGSGARNDMVTGATEPDIRFPRPPLGLWARSSSGSLGMSSGEPGFDAGLVKGVVGVPGRVCNPSHGTPHDGPPGQESLQPKRIPKINL